MRDFCLSKKTKKYPLLKIGFLTTEKMKAKLKIDYNDKLKKGLIYDFKIVNDNIVTCDGVDFGWSEIEPCEDEHTLSEVGRYLHILVNNKNGLLRHSEIEQAVKPCINGLSNRYKGKALSYYMNN